MGRRGGTTTTSAAAVLKHKGNAMKRFLLTFAILAIAWSAAAADELVIHGPKKAAAGESVQLKVAGLPEIPVEGERATIDLAWLNQFNVIVDAPNNDDDFTVDTSVRWDFAPLRWQYVIDFTAQAEGVFVVIADWNDPEAAGLAVHRITIGEAKPVDPDDPEPIPTGGLFVLIVEETDQRPKLPPDQLAILTATAPGSVREYLTQRCAKDADGRPQFRIFDKDNDLAKESAIWRQAWERPRQSIPWILISNVSQMHEGPLPATPEATLELLRKYGG